MKIKLLIMILSMTTLGSCGKSKSGTATSATNENLKSEQLVSYSYQFKINNCDTQEHTFDSKEKYCHGLEDQDLNNGCALAQREALFNKECSEFGNFLAFSTTEKSAPENPGNVHVLQVSIINFLTGGIDSCDYENVKLAFNTQDKNKVLTLCQNSRVKITATSNLGSVNFKAIDLTNNFELPPAEYSEGQTFKFGENQATLRYSAMNPYGFTYVIADEVTNINPTFLSEWNTINKKLSSLKSKALSAKLEGKKVSKDTEEEIQSLEIQLFELAQKMKE